MLLVRPQPLVRLQRGRPMLKGLSRRWPTHVCNGSSASAGDGDLYSEPSLYEAVFDHQRDFSAEVSFVIQEFERHSGREPSSFCELGCGAARHAIAAAKAGLAAEAVDNNQAMLDHAQARASEAQQALHFQLADMRQFTTEAPKDIVAMMMGTLSCLLTNEDAQSCFQAIKRCLVPEGMLVLELDDLAANFDGAWTSPDMWPVLHSGAELLVEYGNELDEFDPATQVLKRHIRVLEPPLEAKSKGRKGRQAPQEKVFGQFVAHQRLFTLQEISLLAGQADLRVQAVYGDFDATVAADAEEASRAVVFLRPVPAK